MQRRQARIAHRDCVVTLALQRHEDLLSTRITFTSAISSISIRRRLLRQEAHKLAACVARLEAPRIERLGSTVKFKKHFYD
jgi:hypothetical protein